MLRNLQNYVQTSLLLVSRIKILDVSSFRLNLPDKFSNILFKSDIKIKVRMNISVRYTGQYQRFGLKLAIFFHSEKKDKGNETRLL